MTTPASAAALLLLALGLVYADDAGHGFIKDDFRWIGETRVQSMSDIRPLLTRSDGFYRPLVAFTFTINSAVWGVAPRAHGLTNFALLVIDAGLVWLLGRGLGLAAGPAVLAAATWAFNFHGINMAVLWISGRTELIVVLGALLTAKFALAGRMGLAGFWCFLALMSKEEAVVLPLMIAAWIAYEAVGSSVARAVAALRRAWPCFAALAAYVVIRLQTTAFWPWNAPEYYRLSASPLMLAENVPQYVDRAVTWPAFVAVVMFAASGARTRLNVPERRVVAFGALWLVSTFALTISVPVRSSLYAVMPSAGAALAAGAVASAAARAHPRRATIAMMALVVLPFLLLPVYWTRNERWVRLADFSSAVINQVRTAAAREPGRPIVLIDDPAARFNLDAAFGNLWPEAAALYLSQDTVVTISDDAPAGTSVFRLDRTQLIRMR